MKQIEATSFGSVAQDYARSRVGFPSELFQRLALFQVGVNEQKILDIGTGTGTLARQFSARGCLVTGLDADERMLNQAKELAKVESLPICFIASNAENIPLADCSFDVITAGQCWHWFDQKKVLSEVRRLLKPSGKLVITHFDWIPLKDNMVEVTEHLIQTFNTGWDYGGGNGVHGHFLNEIALSGFNHIETFSFDCHVDYSHEDWCARIRASAGISSLSEQDRADFSDQLGAMLKDRFPQNTMSVLHRVFAIVAEL